MAEGAQKQTLAQVRLDLERAREKIADLEVRLREADGNLREIMSDIKHLISAVDKMSEKLDKHIGERKE